MSVSNQPRSRPVPRSKKIDFENRTERSIKFHYSINEDVENICEIIGDATGHKSPFEVVQTNQKEKTVCVTFRTKELFDKIVRVTSLKYNDEKLKFFPATAVPLAVRVKDFPYDLPDEELREFFSQYGEITDIRQGRRRAPRSKYLNGTFNGDRIILMHLVKEIPRTVDYKICQLTVTYPGQPPTCNYCKISGHVAGLCPKLHCDLCDQQGHNTFKCKDFIDCAQCEMVHPVNQCRDQHPSLFSEHCKSDDIVLPVDENSVELIETEPKDSPSNELSDEELDVTTLVAIDNAINIVSAEVIDHLIEESIMKVVAGKENEDNLLVKNSQESFLSSEGDSDISNDEKMQGLEAFCEHMHGEASSATDHEVSQSESSPECANQVKLPAPLRQIFDKTLEESVYSARLKVKPSSSVVRPESPNAILARRSPPKKRRPRGRKDN